MVNPVPAYQAGYHGEGIKVGIVDSGIDLKSPEFTGRIDAASKNIVTPGDTLQDQNGHGTAVASVLAANKNDSFGQGIAYASTLLIERTDSSCTAANGCTHYDGDIAGGVDAAVAGGAKIINISLGGSSAAPVLATAIQKATAAGVIVVIAAGNASDTHPSTAEIDDLPAGLIDNAAVSHGLIIAAGATNTAGTALASFSFKAGSHASNYISAPGESILLRSLTGNTIYYQGTSFASPYVAGALALILQAFPNLTPAKAISLLYSTATDLGASGVDPVYGNGFINLTNAFKPQGAASVPGAQSSTAISLTSTALQLGSAFGSGGQLGSALRGGIILDSYGRAFAVNLGSLVHARPNANILFGGLDQFGNTISSDITSGSVHVSFSARDVHSRYAAHSEAGPDADRGRQQFTDVKTSARVTISPATQLGFAHGYDTSRFARTPLANTDGDFLSGNLNGDTNTYRDAVATQIDHTQGAWRFALTTGDTHENVRLGTAGNTIRTQRFDAALTAVHTFGAIETTLAALWTNENGSVLGAYAAPGLGLGSSAKTLAMEAEAKLPLGNSWHVSAAAHAGSTTTDKRGQTLIDHVGTITTSAFRFEINKAEIFGGDRLSFQFSQPLRVENSHINFSVPVSYNYTTSSAVYNVRTASLAPDGREFDSELNYTIGVAGNTVLQLNSFGRINPGHVSGAAPDIGFALRLHRNF